jgi:hypothetical protein
MAWSLQGQLIESCSCNMFCPCWFGVQELMIMDRGWCQGALVVRIDEGSSNGVDLGGRTVTIGVHFPGPTMFDGNATARVFVDDDATDEQRDALEAIAQGRNGGPMEQIAPLVANWLPTQTANISVDESGETITVGVDGTGSVRSQLLRDPDGNSFALRGGGFVAGFGLETAELAPPSGSEWSDAEFPEGGVELKSGARGAITWTG